MHNEKHNLSQGYDANDFTKSRYILIDNQLDKKNILIFLNHVKLKNMRFRIFIGVTKTDYLG